MLPFIRSEENSFTGFKPNEIKKRVDLFENCDWNEWKEAFNTVESIDFTTPPPNIKPWSASPNEISIINKSIRGV